MATTDSNETLGLESSRAPVLAVQGPAARGGAKVAAYFRWKPLFDRCLAAVLLLLCLPILGILVLLVRLTSRGPAIYRQARVGKDGRVFTLYKIRTMRTDAEAGSGAVWSQHNDPRVTSTGRVLRKCHLDEFPQLLNVLKGEMSLVGPRPERPEFVPALSEKISGYRDRLGVLPGITGLAQLNLPPDSDINDVRRKLVLDLEYMEKAGVLLDLRIILCTAAKLLRVPARGILGLKRQVPHFGADALSPGVKPRQVRARRKHPAVRRKPRPR